MGRKAQNKKDKKQVSSEEEEDEEEVQSYEDDDEDDEAPQNFDQMQSFGQHDEKILSQIQKKVDESKEGEQLTWKALYNLKNKEIQFKYELDQEIEKIKNKYELLKQPIYAEISRVVQGQKIDKQYYKSDVVRSDVDIAKVNPSKIDEFWSIVLQKAGVAVDDFDIECLHLISQFNVKMINPQISHIKVQVKFAEIPKNFKNRELSVELKGDSSNPTRTISHELEYIKERSQNSIFTILFDSKSQIAQSLSLAQDLYRIYTNALFFFFNEEDDENYQIDDDDENQEEQQSSEVQPVKKGKKKQKNQQKKQKSVQKPQCKQQ